MVHRLLQIVCVFPNKLLDYRHHVIWPAMHPRLCVCNDRYITQPIIFYAYNDLLGLCQRLAPAISPFTSQVGVEFLLRLNLAARQGLTVSVRGQGNRTRHPVLLPLHQRRHWVLCKPRDFTLPAYFEDLKVIALQSYLYSAETGRLKKTTQSETRNAVRITTFGGGLPFLSNRQESHRCHSVLGPVRWTWEYPFEFLLNFKRPGY